MSKNKKKNSDLTPERHIAYLESLLLVGESAPWTENTAIFVKYLDDPNPEVRATAIRGLWHAASPALMDRLMEMAEKDPSPLVRAKAISALGIYMYEGEMADYGFDWGPMTDILREDELPQEDFERARDFLLAVYVDASRTLDERRFAIEALGFLSDPAVTDLVEEAYLRPEREMKISALFAMGRSGLIRWTDFLGQELYNEDHDIQREAIRAVGEIKMDELGEDLLRLTYDDDREIMLEAIAALGETGWEGGLQRLDELTSHSDPEVADVAQEALEEWLFMDQLMSEEDALDSQDLSDLEDWEDGDLLF